MPSIIESMKTENTSIATTRHSRNGRCKYFLIYLLRAQSLTSLMKDLCQDIKRVISFSRCVNGTFP